MGVCCGRGGEDKKVEACKSIDELILLMNTRIENIPLEKKEINEHLKDKTKQITLINTEGVPDEILAKRPEHLDNLLEKYKEIVKILVSNKRLNLDEVKAYVSNITRHYVLTYDPNHEVDNDYKRLTDFIELKNKK